MSTNRSHRHPARQSQPDPAAPTRRAERQQARRRERTRRLRNTLIEVSALLLVYLGPPLLSTEHVNITVEVTTTAPPAAAATGSASPPGTCRD